MGIIETDNIAYEYIRRDEEGNVEGFVRAIDGVSIDIREGEFISILGGNGSGKSTLAKQLNAILYPTEGSVYVDGKNTADYTADCDFAVRIIRVPPSNLLRCFSNVMHPSCR